MSHRNSRKTKKPQGKQPYPDLSNLGEQTNDPPVKSQRKASAWDEDNLENDNAILGVQQEDEAIRQPLGFNSDNSK